MSGPAQDYMRGVIDGLLTRIRERTRLLREIERAEHPDLIDGKGNRWTWEEGDVYVCGRMAWPVDLLPEPLTAVDNSEALASAVSAAEDYVRRGGRRD